LSIVGRILDRLWGGVLILVVQSVFPFFHLTLLFILCYGFSERFMEVSVRGLIDARRCCGQIFFFSMSKDSFFTIESGAKPEQLSRPTVSLKGRRAATRVKL
jgi:hypothetical protein